MKLNWLITKKKGIESDARRDSAGSVLEFFYTKHEQPPRGKREGTVKGLI